MPVSFSRTPFIMYKHCAIILQKIIEHICQDKYSLMRYGCSLKKRCDFPAVINGVMIVVLWKLRTETPWRDIHKEKVESAEDIPEVQE